jgi:hypothetical protein
VTADRWWVRLAARWLARIDGVSGQLRLAMLALTGISTGVVALEQYGLERYAVPFIAAVAIAVLGYTYVYTEGGVWNQVNRDKSDMGDNYAGPTMLFDARHRSTQLAYLAYVTQNGHEKSFEEIKTRMDEYTHEEWAALREGRDVEEIEEEYGL